MTISTLSWCTWSTCIKLFPGSIWIDIIDPFATPSYVHGTGLAFDENWVSCVANYWTTCPIQQTAILWYVYVEIVMGIYTRFPYKCNKFIFQGQGNMIYYQCGSCNVKYIVIIRLINSNQQRLEKRINNKIWYFYSIIVWDVWDILFLLTYSWFVIIYS